MIGSIARQSTTDQAARAADLATQYLAYIAVIGMAAAVAVVAMMFSAKTALHLVDAAAFPKRQPAQSQQFQPTLPAAQDRLETKNTFAMVPMPLDMKNDVMSSNF